MKFLIVAAFIIALFNITCNNSSTNVPNSDTEIENIKVKDTIIVEKANTTSITIEIEKEPKKPDFQDIVSDFIHLYNTKDIIELNKYINPDYGITILDNPGAYITVNNFTTFSKSKYYSGIFDSRYLNEMQIECQLQFGNIPYYDCNNEGWDKEGCYYSDNASLYLVRLYDAIVEYVLLEEDTKYKNQLIDVETKLTHGIYSTQSFIGFYFGYFNNKWYLLAIDMIAPCSA